MALGAILRQERERRGLTEHQVAEATRMMVQMIREFEEEDFHRIAAAIYGRGFVKLYASFLELDPAPLVKEFEELYARRSLKPEPAPRVPLERFGSAPGEGLQRVSPTAVRAEDGADPLRIPAPQSLRTAAAATGSKMTGSDAASDLFGDPVRDSGASPLDLSAEERVLALPRQPPTEEGRGFRRQAQAPEPQSVGRRNVLDSASHRFDGHPYRPGVGRVVGSWLGRVVNWVAKGLALLGLLLASHARKAWAWLARASRGAARLPWRRIGRLAAVVVPVLLVLWATAVGFRSCARSRSLARSEGASPEGAVVVERMLPPPAGYADR